MYQQKIPEFWDQWKVLQRNSLILRFQKKKPEVVWMRILTAHAANSIRDFTIRRGDGSKNVT